MFHILKGITFLMAAIFPSWGIYLLLKRPIRILNEKIALERRIQKRFLQRKNDQLIESKPGLLERFVRDLDFMLYNTKPNYKKESAVQNFVFFHGIAFSIILIIIGGSSGSYGFGVVIGMMFVFGNYIRHRMRLRYLRLERGYQLAELTGSIASRYNATINPQMKNVLREFLNDEPESAFRRQISEIVRAEQNYTSAEELKDAIDKFVFSVNTSFARELGLTILKSLSTKEFVGDTLSRIDRKIHQNIKDIKKETNEKVDIRNLSMFHLIAFPGTFIAILFMINITETSLLHYQFQTNQGRTGFTLSVLSIGVAWFMSSWFSRQPNDY